MSSAGRRWGFIILALIALIACGIWFAVHRYSPLTREYVVKALQERYDSDVEIKDFSAKLFPSPHAIATDIVFRQHGRKDVPPLVTIRKLTIETAIMGLLRSPRRIDRVRIEGLDLQISHQKQDDPHGSKLSAKPPSFLVDEVIADGTLLRLIPKEPGKEPKRFEISQLRLRSAGTGRPMNFVSTLANYKPPGEIHSEGQFGPWNSTSPGNTPVSGTYTFRNADLGVFKGIAGTLSSDGKYQGVLERIDVNGTTDTPNFLLTESGHAVDLKTQFHSTVDGLSGDTFLDPVNAQFLHSQVVARGGVYGKPGVKGRSIELDVNLQNARVEDLLYLAMKSLPPTLTGAIVFQAKLAIPPGPSKVIDKLYLNGNFAIGSARFSSLDIQRKVTVLSERARGQVDDDPSDRVVSNMRGHFRLNNGTATFSTFSFAVPGALISLDGAYGLRSEALNFEGSAQMDAKLSQMTTGKKRLLLKIVDPFFRKDGKTVIPIRITGTRSQPSFGLRFGGRK
jgi:AsmA-like C-terminal region